MKPENGKIIIVDDDASIRRSLSLLLRSAGYSAVSYASIDELLDSEDHGGSGCILLDVFLDGESGVELQEVINQNFPTFPIIYMTGQGDVPMSVQVMKKGALNFLQKPMDDRKLVEAVEEALLKSSAKVNEQQQTRRIRALVEKLTPREYEILQHLSAGLLNKQIADKLNITEHTVKLHRGKITEKLGVKSVAELVRIAQKINP